MGNWAGETMRVTNERGNETVSVPVSRYGYLKLRFDADSTYTFNLAVLKDVKIEKSILGVEGNVLILPAIYKSSRFGTFRQKDSTITLFSQEDSIFVTPAHDLSALQIRFTDKSHRKWLCTLVPEE
jgi:hypothetical protein